MALTNETIERIRAILLENSYDKVWEQFPPHMIEFYARSYMANVRNQKHQWVRQISDLIIEDILLVGDKDG